MTPLAMKPPQPRLEIRQYDYGWNIVYYDVDGHVKHLLTAENEIQAFRAAHRLVHIYKLSGQARVALLGRPEFLMDVERLMHRNHGEK